VRENLRLLTLWLALLLSTTEIRAQGIPSTAGKVMALRLESIDVVGTTRLDAKFLHEEFALKDGTALDDQFVMSTRQKILSLGIFKSAILYLKRGSRAGLAKLTIEVEDDDSILTDWGLGGLLGMNYEQRQTTGSTAPPLGYRLELLGRNLFNSLHRGFIMADIDAEGVLRQGRAIYGLPRFTNEDVQFDTEIAATDVRRRYLDANGFGGRVQGIWTESRGAFDFQYGPAMYVNREGRFAVPGFPDAVAGPKVALLRETRLNRFLPGEGYLLNAGFLYAVTKSYQSLLELRSAYTVDVLELALLTVDAKLLTIGKDGFSWRGEGRIDVPLGPSHQGTQKSTDLFMRFRGGRDHFEDTDLSGSAGIFGLRYHSSGFIAEIALEITKSPGQLIDAELDRAAAGARHE